MTIIIPTEDLVGIIKDVLPFVSPDKEDTVLRAVRFEWDGTMLHTQSTNELAIAWASWHPDDAPAEDGQDSILALPGGDDDPRAWRMPFDDAKKLADIYALPAKFGRIPLHLTINTDRIAVRRDRNGPIPGITTTWATQDDTDAFPNIRSLLAQASALEPVKGIAFNPEYLAAFKQVRPRGPLEMAFTGESGMVLVQVGNRFCGGITPVRRGDERLAA